MDCGPLGSSVHGILQARILYGLLFSSPGNLPHPGTEPGSAALQTDCLPHEPPGKSVISLTYEIFKEISIFLWL